MSKVLQSPNKCAMINQPQPSSYHAPPAAFVPVVISGKLAFKFDPRRGLIEWQHRGEKHVIDLAAYSIEV